MKSAPNLIAVCGPTCSGKSALALRIAQKTGGVIINTDSQQIYSELPILSAQPTLEERGDIPHYMYGIVSGAELFTVARWLEMAMGLIKEIKTRPLIFTGGTGLYYNALFNGISKIPNVDEAIRDKVRSMDIADVANQLGDEADGNTQRMRRALEVKLSTGKSIKEWHKEEISHPFTINDFKILHVDVSRETTYEKINTRLWIQIENGALDEVRALAAKNLDPALPIMKAHGVPEFIRHFNGEITLEEAVTKAQQNVRNYAKRQMTWFRNQLPQRIDITPDMSDNQLYEALFQQS